MKRVISFSLFLATTLLFAVRLNAQWAPLPDAPYAFAPPNNTCLYTVVNPAYIIPAADKKIVYSALCSYASPHSPQGYLMVSDDDLTSAHSAGDAKYIKAFRTRNNECAYYSLYQAESRLYYSPNLLASNAFFTGFYYTGVGTAITPNYVYAVVQGSITEIHRFTKSGGQAGSFQAAGYIPYDDKLTFINDSVGFLLAKYSANLSKTALIRITGNGSSWLPVLIDSVDAISDYHILPTGEIFLLKKSGAILKSINNGGAFLALSSAPTGTYSCIHLANSLTGFVGGLNGVLLKTANGGLNWSSETSNTTKEIKAIYTFNYSSYFVDASLKVFRSDQVLGTVEKYPTPDLAVFPNPAADAVTVQFESNNAHFLTVTDLCGKTLLTTCFSSSVSLDISGLAPGAYFIRISGSADGTAVQKLIIAR
jgi:hypothetical protein